MDIIKRKPIFYSVIYKFLLNVFNIAIPVIVAPYINGLLDKQEYGAYNTSLSMLTYFIIMGTFGIYSYGLREYSKLSDTNDKTELFSTLFVIGVVTNVVSLILYIGYVLFIAPKTSQDIYLIMGIQLLANIFMTEWLNEAEEQFLFITIKTVIIRTASTILLFMVVKGVDDTSRYALLTTLTILVNNIVGFIRTRCIIKFDIKRIRISKYIKPLFILLLISNINLMFTQFDKVMIGNFVGEVENTVYTLASNVMNMVGVLMLSSIIVTVPRLNYYIGENKIQEYLSLLQRSCRGYLMMCIPSCVGIFLLSYEIMYLYATPNYIESHEVLQLFAVQFIITAMATICNNQILYVHGKERVVLRILGVGGGVNLLAKTILVMTEMLSPTTAVITTMLSELVVLIAMLVYTRKLVDINIVKITSKYLFISLLFIPIVLFIQYIDLSVVLTVILSVVMCATIYLCILLLIKDEILLQYTKKFFLKIKKILKV